MKIEVLPVSDGTQSEIERAYDHADEIWSTVVDARADYRSQVDWYQDRLDVMSGRSARPFVFDRHDFAHKLVGVLGEDFFQYDPERASSSGQYLAELGRLLASDVRSIMGALARKGEFRQSHLTDFLSQFSIDDSLRTPVKVAFAKAFRDWIAGLETGKDNLLDTMDIRSDYSSVLGRLAAQTLHRPDPQGYQPLSQEVLQAAFRASVGGSSPTISILNEDGVEEIRGEVDIFQDVGAWGIAESYPSNEGTRHNYICSKNPDYWKSVRYKVVETLEEPNVRDLL